MIISHVPFTALLLPPDFESVRGRTGLLLQRIVWFCERTGEPISEPHVADLGRWPRSSQAPIAHYEAESNLPARRRRHPSLVATNASGRGVTAVVSSKGPNDDE